MIRSTLYRFRYLLLAILTFCFAIQVLDRVKTAVLIPFISQDIGLSNFQIGIGMAIMMVFYGPTQMLTGWLCDKFGSRRLVIFSIATWSVMTYWLGLIGSVEEWYLRMALFGILIGTEFIPTTRLLVRYFPPLQRARAQSVLSVAWIVTPALAPIVSTWMYVTLGNSWREVFFFLAYVGIIPLLLAVMFVFDKPENNRFVSKDEAVESYEEEIQRGLITEQDVRSGNFKLIEEKDNTQDMSFLQMLKTPGYIPLIFVYVAAQLAYWGVMTFSAQYLTQVHQFNVMKMGMWASLYFAAGAVGSFVSGYASDHVFKGRRKPMLIVCFVSMIPFVILLANLEKGISPFILLLTLAGAGFFSNMVWAPAISYPANLFPVKVYGKAMGLVNGVAYVLGAASPFIMGWLIVTDPVSKVSNYLYAWMWVAATAVLGIVASSMLVDKKGTAESPGKTMQFH
ncbi:MAG: MFS transporter [Negativicutes bacterium]|nr:MFS transporter [Negativicutes bacterium]